MKQTIQGHDVETFRNKTTHERFAFIPTRFRADADGVRPTGEGIKVPAEICSLAAGPDEWMREIQFTCQACHARTQAGKLQSGYCGECVAEAEQENARLDGRA